jgi:hypothetical protein
MVMKKRALTAISTMAFFAMLSLGIVDTVKAQSWTSADGGSSIGTDSLYSSVPVSVATYNNELYAIMNYTQHGLRTTMVHTVTKFE